MGFRGDPQAVPVSEKPPHRNGRAAISSNYSCWQQTMGMRRPEPARPVVRRLTWQRQLQVGTPPEAHMVARHTGMVARHVRGRRSYCSRDGVSR